jgi:hypothetical protein
MGRVFWKDRSKRGILLDITNHQEIIHSIDTLSSNNFLYNPKNLITPHLDSMMERDVVETRSDVVAQAVECRWLFGRQFKLRRLDRVLSRQGQQSLIVLLLSREIGFGKFD